MRRRCDLRGLHRLRGRPHRTPPALVGRVALRALDQVAEPARRADSGVLEDPHEADRDHRRGGGRRGEAHRQHHAAQQGPAAASRSRGRLRAFDIRRPARAGFCARSNMTPPAARARMRSPPHRPVRASVEMRVTGWRPYIRPVVEGIASLRASDEAERNPGRRALRVGLELPRGPGKLFFMPPPTPSPEPCRKARTG